jgi:hypothetical protein
MRIPGRREILHMLQDTFFNVHPDVGIVRPCPSARDTVKYPDAVEDTRFFV